MYSVSVLSGIREFRTSTYWARSPILHCSCWGTGIASRKNSFSSDKVPNTGQIFDSNRIFKIFDPVLLLASVAVMRAMTATSLLGEDNNERTNFAYQFRTCGPGVHMTIDCQQSNNVFVLVISTPAWYMCSKSDSIDPLVHRTGYIACCPTYHNSRLEQLSELELVEHNQRLLSGWQLPTHFFSNTSY